MLDIEFDDIDITKSISVINSKIHIRIKQRNGKKSNTFIENIPSDLDIEHIAKTMRKKFACNGCVHKDGFSSVIQLFGDQRVIAKKFLIENMIANEEDILIHGY